MKTCRDVADALGDLVADEHTAEHRAALREHLDGCPDCMVLLESYRHTITLARRLDRPAVPPGLLARLQQHISTQPPAGA
jgi:hypothetical protein